MRDTGSVLEVSKVEIAEKDGDAEVNKQKFKDGGGRQGGKADGGVQG